jgi:FK506-binding nuclear protein
MAAIDPSAEPEYAGTVDADAPARATLKLVRQPLGPGDDESEYDSEEEDQLKALLNGDASDEDEESSDEEANGGPSDPSKSKRARREAAIESLKQALAGGEGDDGDMSVDDVDGAPKAETKGKGKGKATDLDEEEDDEDDSEDLEIEEFVICTLNPSTVRDVRWARKPPADSNVALPTAS